MEANLNDANSLKQVFDGACIIFGVTDFWQFVGASSTRALVESRNITWNEACYLQEVQQGTNIIDAASEQENPQHLSKLILSTLADQRLASNGKYTWVYHFDGKARHVQYLKDKAQEDPAHLALLNKTSYLHMGFYLDNWKMNPMFAPRKVRNISFFPHSLRLLTTFSDLTGALHFDQFVARPTQKLIQSHSSILSMTLAHSSRLLYLTALQVRPCLARAR